MTNLAAQRRFLAEEILVCAAIRSAALIEAFAEVPREDFLPPGPWAIRGESDVAAGPRQTPDDDPRHVNHNVSVAIDIDRQLFNGAPTAVAPLIDALELTAGARVLHIGCGLGYYTAIIAQVVGPGGNVTAIEVDEGLATLAARNLAACPWVAVRAGNGAEPSSGVVDAILVHAGVTHPLDAWLDALAPGGRLVFPLTVAMPGMGHLGKGFVFRVTKDGSDAFAARPLSPTMIYSAVGLRDEALNPLIGAAMTKGFVPRVTRLRRDPHDATAACWVHAPTFCLQE